MRFAVLKGEKSLSGVARRVYQVKGKLTQPQAKEAEAALARANPHLADVASAPPGTIIAVPDAAVPMNPAEEVHPAAAVAGTVVSAVPQALDALSASLAASSTEVVADAKNTLAVLQSSRVQRLAGRNPDLKAALTQHVEQVRTRIKDAQAAGALQEQTLAQMQQDLSRLLALLGGTPSP